MSQCASCAKNGPEAKCKTCVLLYPNTAPPVPEILQCLDCGDGEMMEHCPGWLLCGLCKKQVQKSAYGVRHEKEKDGVTTAMAKAMLAEDARQGDHKSNTKSGSSKKDRRGGKVDPDTQSPGEGFRMGGRTRDDSVLWSRSQLLARKSEVIRVTGVDATTAEANEALGQLMSDGGEVA